MKTVTVRWVETRQLEVDIEVEDDFEPGDQQDKLLDMAVNGGQEPDELSSNVELHEWDEN